MNTVVYTIYVALEKTSNSEGVYADSLDHSNIQVQPDGNVW